MHPAYGIIIVIALVASVALYILVVHPKPQAKGKAKTKPRAKPKGKQKTAPVKTPPLKNPKPVPSSSGRWGELPPEVPRDINTIKIIAMEDPEVVARVVRKWLRERR